MSIGNTICWTDIPVTDLKRAIKFYSGVLAKEVRHFNEHGMEFGLLPHEENNVSGCLCQAEGVKPSEHGTMVYLNVDGRLDGAVDAVLKGGGKVLQEKHSIGPYGFRAIIRDSEGNRVALHSHTA